MRHAGVIAVLAICPQLAAAQSTLGGTIVDAVTRRPVPGAEVLVIDLNRRVVTDSLGIFRLDRLPGDQRLTAAIRRIGYRPVRFQLDPIRDSLWLDVDLDPLPVALDSVNVVGAPDRGVRMAEFAERRARGFGRFVPPERLRASEHRPLADVLEGLGGIRLAYGRGSQRFAWNTRAGCPYAILYNGLWLFKPRTGTDFGARSNEPVPLETFSIADLEAIEVYTGPATVPAEYSGIGSACGLIILHARER